VDAIRWVLGEHAPSYLRSKALEDVIFAGSDAAGPLGMAEVCLTFFNEDGAAPPGYESYAEIQVTRRTFRNGESEFLINKVPCRLKDIAELFLDTGAGARGYAIIEQGKIMTIVNARPEEKRMIVEEAAGVAKFRVRKKEAERKMENTRANLARVKDILDEVKRQLGSLERQVRKAERYKALKDELRGLDLAVAARKFRDLSRERAGVASDLAVTEDSLLAVRTELSRLEAEIELTWLRPAEPKPPSAPCSPRQAHEEVAPGGRVRRQPETGRGPSRHDRRIGRRPRRRRERDGRDCLPRYGVRRSGGGAEEIRRRGVRQVRGAESDRRIGAGGVSAPQGPGGPGAVRPDRAREPPLQRPFQRIRIKRGSRTRNGNERARKSGSRRQGPAWKKRRGSSPERAKRKRPRGSFRSIRTGSPAHLRGWDAHRASEGRYSGLRGREEADA
jgi:chromosome segregation protein